MSSESKDNAGKKLDKRLGEATDSDSNQDKNPEPVQKDDDQDIDDLIFEEKKKEGVDTMEDFNKLTEKEQEEYGL